MNESAQLLIVDDDASSRQRIAAMAKTCGIAFRIASDGAEAWASIQKNPARIVITDVNMPNMDGFALLDRLRTVEPYVYVILLTSLDGTEHVAEGMSRGADDYLTKPFSPQHLIGRLRVAERITSLQRDLEHVNRELAHDLATAERVQQALLPQGTPDIPGITCAWHLTPCQHVAGDLLGIMPLGTRHLGAYILDVTGHGVAAALLSVQIGRTLQHAVEHRSSLLLDNDDPSRLADPSEVLDRLSRQFPMRPPANQFFTLVYVILDVVSGAVHYSVGGHPPPLVKRANGKIEALPGTGTMLGLEDLGRFDSYTANLEKGDQLIMVSDGIVETQSPVGSEFGNNRLLACIEQLPPHTSPQNVIESVLETGHRWRGGATPQDDCSLVAITFGGSDQE